MQNRTTSVLLIIFTVVSLINVCFCFIAPRSMYMAPAKTQRCLHDRYLRRLRSMASFPSDEAFDDNNDDDNDDEDFLLLESLSSSSAVLLNPRDDVSCTPPSTMSHQRATQQRTVFIVSDATGVTAKAALSKCLVQFDTCDEDVYGAENCNVHTRVFTFIRSEPALRSILDKAAEKQACVMFTFADTLLRSCAVRHCQAQGICHIDLVGPTLQILSDFLQQEPLGLPLTLWSAKQRAHSSLGDSYYRRIEAVEFTLKADDGQSPWLLPEADVILVGVSRSGKTPLSVVLAQTMGLKVANVPLVVECPPPEELVATSSMIDPNRVFCLTLAPSELRRIRSSRLKRQNVRKMERKYNVGIKASSNYADRAHILTELKHARALATQHQWTEIDVTGRAVEETASLIVQYLNERQDGSSLLSAKHLT